MAGELEALRAEVEEAKAVNQATITLLTGLVDRYRAAEGSMDEIKEITSELDATTTALAAAVEANTPAAAEAEADASSGPVQTEDTLKA